MHLLSLFRCVAIIEILPGDRQTTSTPVLEMPKHETSQIPISYRNVRENCIGGVLENVYISTREVLLLDFI